MRAELAVVDHPQKTSATSRSTIDDTLPAPLPALSGPPPLHGNLMVSDPKPRLQRSNSLHILSLPTTATCFATPKPLPTKSTCMALRTRRLIQRAKGVITTGTTNLVDPRLLHRIPPTKPISTQNWPSRYHHNISTFAWPTTASHGPTEATLSHKREQPNIRDLRTPLRMATGREAPNRLHASHEASPFTHTWPLRPLPQRLPCTVHLHCS